MFPAYFDFYFDSLFDVIIFIVSSPPLGIGGAEVFPKMAVWRGKVFFPKPGGAYSGRGGRGGKGIFPYICVHLNYTLLYKKVVYKKVILD